MTLIKNSQSLIFPAYVLLAGLATLTANHAQASERVHTYRYNPEHIGGDTSRIARAFGRDYVYACRDDGSVHMIRDWRMAWSARENGLFEQFQDQCNEELARENLPREQAAAAQAAKDAEARHARALLEKAKAEIAAQEQEDARKAAAEQALVGRCVPYFADPTHSRWDSQSGLVHDCNSLTARKAPAAGTGETPKPVCSEEISGDRAQAWRLSREAGLLSKQGDYAGAKTKYAEAEEALKSARAKISSGGARRCIAVSANGAKAGDAGVLLSDNVGGGHAVNANGAQVDGN